MNENHPLCLVSDTGVGCLWLLFIINLECFCRDDLHCTVSKAAFIIHSQSKYVMFWDFLWRSVWLP